MKRFLSDIFRDLPIRKKLMLLIMLTCGVVLVCAILVFVVSESVFFRNDQREELDSLTEITSRNVLSPLQHGDRKSAGQALAALAADPEVLGAYLFDRNGQLVARYLSDKGREANLALEQLPATTSASQYQATLRQLQDQSETPSSYVPYMTSIKAIVVDGQQLGTLLIHENYKILQAHFYWILPLVLLVLTGAFVIALIISARLQQLISLPLLSLVESMREMSLSKDYTLRVAKPSNDEIGQLYESFNDMVAEIEERDEILRQRQQHLLQLAHFDPLTRLPNRVLFYDRLSQAIRHAERAQEALAVMFVDLDHFKDINDTLGHQVGDLLLMDVGKRLTGAVRESDTVGRLGGDEFTVFAQDIDNAENAAVVAKKIVDVFAKPFLLEGKEIFITASVGVTLFPTDGDSVDELLKNADMAMYQAKDKGKNAYQLFAREMHVQASQRLTMANDLRHALDRGELVLYYQPKVDLVTGMMAGVEALVRWQHPELGLIPPGKFIPLAEETGLIFPLNEWVLRTACQQGRAWQLANGRGVRVSINLSAAQFKRQDMVQTVCAALEESGLSPELLEVELTETALMQRSESTVAALREFRQRGIRIAIDDFGTGYSSLSYLHRFPIDILKIDKSFIWNIARSEQDSVIVAAIIAMARSLKLNVVAEGVENLDQLVFLQENGCHQVQGYLVSHPVPAWEVDWLLDSVESLLPEHSVPLPLF